MSHRTALLFSGQGAQAVGMGKDLAAAFPRAREVFDEVDEALSQHLSKMMFEGAESDLNLTENTQPAILLVSAAALEVLEVVRKAKSEAGVSIKTPVTLLEVAEKSSKIIDLQQIKGDLLAAANAAAGPNKTCGRFKDNDNSVSCRVP